MAKAAQVETWRKRIALSLSAETGARRVIIDELLAGMAAGPNTAGNARRWADQIDVIASWNTGALTGKLLSISAAMRGIDPVDFDPESAIADSGHDTGTIAVPATP